MYKTKYLLIFGTRPEAIKMAPVLRALEKSPLTHCVVCITGQHEDLLGPMLCLFDIRPQYRLQVMSHDQQLSGLTSTLLTELEKVIMKERPDWVIVQGDTTSAMVGSLAAFYRKVRVAHVEAGIRSHNLREPFPEEVNRRIIDVISDLHFAPTAQDKENLVREGHSSTSVHVTGNTSIDALRYMAAQPFAMEGSVLARLPLEGKRTVLVTVHRRENHGAPLIEICGAVRALAAQYRDTMHIVVPVHPNPNVSGPVHQHLGGIDNITLTPPLDYQEFIALAKTCFMVMTDSGGLQEELPWLGKPILVLRNVTERRAAVLAGAARLVGLTREAIVNAACELMDNADLYKLMAQPRPLFGDGKAGERIATILQSYAPAVTTPELEVPADTNTLHPPIPAIPIAAIPTAGLLLDTPPTFEGSGGRML